MTITKVTDAGLDKSRIVTPIIINGDMSVAQRATSVTGVTSGTYKTIDRFRLMISSAGTWTVSQSTTVPTGQGFNKSFKLDCTTADASLGAGDILGMTQKIEGFNQAPVKKGTAKFAEIRRGISWLDMGSFDDLNDCSNYIRAIEKRQNFFISSPEEIAYLNNWITKKKLVQISNQYNNEYGKYLKKL